MLPPWLSWSRCFELNQVATTALTHCTGKQITFRQLERQQWCHDDFLVCCNHIAAPVRFRKLRKVVSRKALARKVRKRCSNSTHNFTLATG